MSDLATRMRETSTRTRLLAGAAVIAVALAVGLMQSSAPQESTAPPPSKTQTQQARAAAPPAIRRLYAQGDRLLHLNGDAFVAKMKRLEGRPVLINKWASWCAPCRREFVLLRRASARFGTRIAFLGLNASDQERDAEKFLRTHPTIYPHVRDPDEQIAGAFQAGGVFPQTILIDKTGDVVRIRSGEFATDQQIDTFLKAYL